MTAEFAQAMDRWVEEIRAAYGIPPAMVGRVGTCRNCDGVVQGGANTSTGWTHIGDWQGVRCQGALTGAVPQAEVPQRSPAETLAELDAAVEGRCAGPGCSAPLTERSKSAYFCGPVCQEEWTRRQAGRPSPGSAPVRGSGQVAAGPMRWRPDLMTAFDDTGLTLLDRHHRDDTGLDYCVFTDPDSDRAFLRVDDGHRFVGIEVPWAELEESGPAEPFRRLERELGDRRRLDPEPAPDPWSTLGEGVVPPTGLSAEQMHATIREWLRANFIDPDLVPQDAQIEVREGRIHCEVVRRVGAGDLVRDGHGVARTRISVRHRCRPPWPGTGPCPNCVGRCEPGCGCTGWGPRAVAPVDTVPAERSVDDERSRLLWLPDPPADPEAPTMADLAGGIDLTPHVAAPLTTAQDPWGDLQAAWQRLVPSDHNPVVRVDASAGIAEQMIRQGWPSPGIGSAVNQVLGVPVVWDTALPPGAWRAVYADGRRIEHHTCQWEPLLDSDGPHRCVLSWSDGERCDAVAADPAVVRTAERLVGPPATGGTS